MPSLGIVIPVYNEGEQILKTLDALYRVISNEGGKSVSRLHWAIHLIYDTDDDTTLPPVKRELARYPGLTLLKNKYGRGVAQALKTGLEEAKEDLILVTMADGSDEYSIIPQMLKLADEGADIVCPSRYMKGGKLEGAPFIKGNLSRLAGLGTYFLSGLKIHDISNSYRLYNRKVLEGMKIESEAGFAVATEITVKAYLKGFKIVELPTTWKERTHGKSNFKTFKWLPHYLKWYLKIFYARPNVGTALACPEFHRRVAVRVAADSDLPEITSLAKKYALDSEDMRAREFIVAEEDGKIVGIARLLQHPDCDELCSL
ncbi:MAG: glycosyltransferase, partial [Candidatus Margulisiibacteriota bacterium]